jgi:hypothetical protein
MVDLLVHTIPLAICGLQCIAGMFILAIFGFWIWMLADCLKRDDWEVDSDKILWTIVIILTFGVGAAIYYFLVKRKIKRKKND